MLVMIVTFITGNLKDFQQRINYVKTPNHSITQNLDYYGTKTRVEFDGAV